MTAIRPIVGMTVAMADTASRRVNPVAVAELKPYIGCSTAAATFFEIFTSRKSLHVR
jgi:hypothetical protein